MMGKIRKFFQKTFVLTLALATIFVTPVNVIALSQDRLEEFSQNNILFYNPDSNNECMMAGGVINRKTESDGSDVYILGEASTMDGILTDKIKQKLPKVSISTLSGLSENWASSLDVNAASSRGILVMAFGADSGDTFDAQSFLDALTGASVKVVFITAYGLDTLNSTLQTTAKDNENIYIGDFATSINSNVEKYISGTSLTADGADSYARTISDLANSLTTSKADGNFSSGLADFQINFVDKYHDIAVTLSIEYGIPWETVMAQGILESAAGTKQIKQNNFFGIAAYDSDTSKAREYKTPEEGWRGYYENIRYTSVYRNNGVFQGATVTDPYEYAVAIKQAGYATDPEYVGKLAPLISSIEKYSKQKGWASSLQIARANPVWFENAEKNSQGVDAKLTSTNIALGPFCSLESNNGTYPGTISGESNVPIKSALLSKAAQIACDPRTTEYGELQTGHLDGKTFQVRLCKLDKPGYQIYGNDGGLGAGTSLKSNANLKSAYVTVNSIVSGAFAALAHKYYEEHNGGVLQGTSGYRTQTYQEYLANTNDYAADLGKSKHEAGLAVDIVTNCGGNSGRPSGPPGGCGSEMDNWLTKVVGGYNKVEGEFGLIRPVSNEAWHVQMPVWEINEINK